MKLIYLEWEDAIAAQGWHNEKEIKDWVAKDNAIVSEVGWVYAENKTHIVLVSRKINEIDKGKEYESYGLLQKIPKTWIRKRKTLKT